MAATLLDRPPTPREDATAGGTKAAMADTHASSLRGAPQVRGTGCKGKEQGCRGIANGDVVEEGRATAEIGRAHV